MLRIAESVLIKLHPWLELPTAVPKHFIYRGALPFPFAGAHSLIVAGLAVMAIGQAIVSCGFGARELKPIGAVQQNFFIPANNLKGCAVPAIQSAVNPQSWTGLGPLPRKPLHRFPVHQARPIGRETPDSPSAGTTGFFGLTECHDGLTPTHRHGIAKSALKPAPGRFGETVADRLLFKSRHSVFENGGRRTPFGGPLQAFPA